MLGVEPSLMRPFCLAKTSQILSPLPPTSTAPSTRNADDPHPQRNVLGNRRASDARLLDSHPAAIAAAPRERTNCRRGQPFLSLAIGYLYCPSRGHDFLWQSH